MAHGHVTRRVLGFVGSCYLYRDTDAGGHEVVASKDVVHHMDYGR